MPERNMICTVKIICPHHSTSVGDDGSCTDGSRGGSRSMERIAAMTPTLAPLNSLRWMTPSSLTSSSSKSFVSAPAMRRSRRWW